MSTKRVKSDRPSIWYKQGTFGDYLYILYPNGYVEFSITLGAGVYTPMEVIWSKSSFSHKEFSTALRYLRVLHEFVGYA